MRSFMIIFMLAQCPQTVIDNRTNQWTKFDQQTYDTAIKRCKIHFPDSPCLKKFIKLEERRYRAICGSKGNK